MKKQFLTYVVIAMALLALVGCKKKCVEKPPVSPVIPQNMNIFDNVVFFDGYAKLVEHPSPSGVKRTNTEYIRKLSDNEKKALVGISKMKVDIKAACDNYDRIGWVDLYVVPKGKGIQSATFKIEMGRYITPFMNKNEKPNIVPYEWDMSHLRGFFANKAYNNEVYDFYISLSVFGVPYAAQKEVKGCKGRNDVFIGSLNFEHVKPSETHHETLMIPITIRYRLNNYKNTDEQGKAIKTITFDIDNKEIKGAKLYLITSNHGANEGGEEYNRRKHFIKINGNLVHGYMPFVKSCEPYRKYNTHPNFIYWRDPMTDANWQKSSNWCPGAIIPTRVIKTEHLKKGKNTFTIEVPGARFVDKKGDIPVSAYIMGE